ncbi:Endoribonuclease Dicer-like [Quillaja saponaria]|uniref:Endoribonuclease Dicer-like n=1 Tax=Quillaja saponaria TaxID=32244 RepID=A0AAD7QB79_QUISA|nr:Endoribonuclease Dicer-like [Quillaja saponaria]KAJ7978288.1 Endoribonuclease Dicer-like [Quillaja saponaria]
MEALSMEIDRQQELSANPVPFARSYQLEALEKAIKQNTIVFLETGSGKTLIAIMLLRSYAYLLRKPSSFIAIFLVPKVVLVPQQAQAVKVHTDLNVGEYWGDMGVDFWDAAKWKQEIEKHEVLVMTPAILLNGLRHCFFKLSMIKVLIIDECHNARGRHPYACIMTEFYHRQLCSGVSDLPRIFGMTASPIKSKGGNSEFTYWQKIHELETLMNSKVYTCVNESVLAEIIPIPTPKFKFYSHKEIPYTLYTCLVGKLKSLKERHELSLRKSDFTESTAVSTHKMISKIFSDLLFCLDELGVWLALKAAKSLSSNKNELFSWGELDVFGEEIVRSFRSDAIRAIENYIPSGPQWSIAVNVIENTDEGLLTTKVGCLIESLLEYRGLNDMRCIVFVERVITAVVLQSLLNELLPKYNVWKTKYIAGNNSGLQSQTRKRQNEIVEEFRRGSVNIIVATSILEEGLDVQSCNLVIRFDPSSTVCSFIQSRGRARMQNSDYILMVKSGDSSTHSRLKKYLASGDIMRKESLRHSSLPCASLETDLYHEESYCVESTGAIATLSSSISLIYFYCSRLPSDCYFKPTPRWDKENGMLHLPKSCPLQTVHVQGGSKFLKQIACLEACKQLHNIGALTDNLVPDIVMEEAEVQEFGNEAYNDEQPSYIPPQLVNCCSNTSEIMYHCYLIEMKQKFSYDIPVHDVVLLTRSELGSDIGSLQFELFVGRGSLSVNFRYVGGVHLTPEQVLLSRRYQVTLFRVLLDHNLNKLTEVLDKFCLGDNLEIDYLMLPATGIDQRPSIIDWVSVNICVDHINHTLLKDHARNVWTINGWTCTCKLLNSLVYTPHNGHVYCITGTLELNGNSLLNLRDGEVITYKKYYQKRYGIRLFFEQEPLFKARRIFQVKNYLQGCRKQKEKESRNTSVELPPELCSVILSPISISTVYTFSFVPSIMHRLESLLVADNLKRMHLESDHCTQNDIPTFKVLEAITTKKCQEAFHLESLETLGDSFLKYAASQQLFKTYQNHHEGLLSVKKEKIISNAALCSFGCGRKISGFIRNEYFDPKRWIIPGERSGSNFLEEELLSKKLKIYVLGRRKVKRKTIADVVEALIGAFLSTGGEKSALLFLSWIGIKVDFDFIPHERHFHLHPEKLVNVRYLESLLNYSFRDTSLLVEALTHGSYMLPEIPRCYQRLEFLGDAVLDYLITLHLYNKYPGMSPGLLTDMRAASVNNDCYARSSIKAELHKHILHASQELHKHIIQTIDSFEKLSSESTFGWESETSFPKVLGDIVESLAGAILLDSGYNKEIVFQSIRPLLEPLVTPETVRLHPVRELTELCQKENYNMRKPFRYRNNGVSFVTIEVEANGFIYNHTSTSSDKKIAKKLASKEVLKSLKERQI